MSQTSIDFLNLFVRSPGELLYFFTVIAISLASLFMAIGQRLRRPEHVAAKRYTVALFGVVLAWVALLAGALFTLLTDQDAVTVLPPLERLASFSTIILLSWAFLTADYEGWGNNPGVLLAGMLGVTFSRLYPYSHPMGGGGGRN